MANQRAPIEKIIRKPLLLSKFKKMLDHIISLETNEDYFSELFEAKLSNRLIYDITNINRNEYIKTKTSVVNKEFHRILDEYQDSLIGNKKYTFEFKELPIEDIFGRVIEVQVNF